MVIWSIIMHSCLTAFFSCSEKEEEEEEEEEISTSPSEFASDAFDSFNINKDNVRKEMEQLVLERTERIDTAQGALESARDCPGNKEVLVLSSVMDSFFHFAEETPDWERELQEELQEYDVVEDDAESHDANWDREIEEMLKADS